jgi:hypothetical protein
VIVRDPAYAEVLFICERLRPKSRAEMFMAMPDEHADTLARFIHGVGGVRWLIYKGPVPAAMIGAYPLHRGVWGLYGFGTPAYDDVMLTATRLAKREMMPAVLDAGAHRAECMSPVDHEDTHRWLEMLGAEREARLRAWGGNGEDVFLYAWTR